VEPSHVSTGTATRTTADQLLAAFAAAVQASASDHRTVGGWADVITEVTAHRTGSDRRVALAPSLAAAEPQLVDALRAAGAIVIVPDGDDPAATVADVGIGLVRGELGVAETGSVLVSEHTLGDRVVTMLCHRLIQVVHSGDIVARLDDVARWMSERRGIASFVSLMTGPSRTADIERSLTIGVQGPQEVGVRVLTRPLELIMLDLPTRPTSTGDAV
jgi:L-lactate dehydrogenase complex protein LldG